MRHLSPELMSTLRFAFLMIFITFSSVGVRAGELLNSEVNSTTAQLAAALARVTHMSASFTQLTTDRTLRVLQENTGYLWVNP